MTKEVVIFLIIENNIYKKKYCKLKNVTIELYDTILKFQAVLI